MKEAVAGVSLEQFAAVIAALAEAFPLRSVLALEEIEGARWTEVDRGWTERLDRDPELRSWYEHEVATATTRMCGRGTKAKLVRWSAGARSEADGVSTNAAPTFLAPQPVPLKPDGEWVEAALEEEPDDPFMKTGGTMTAFDAVRAARALPFVNAPSSGDRPRPSEGASIRAMPFQPASREQRDDEENTRTSFQPLRSALPFQAGAASGPPPPPPPPSRPSVPSAGATQAIRIVPGVGLPFQSNVAPPSRPPALQASAKPADEPPMPMERHAYMCLELALDPARTDEVLARYGVSPEVRARADGYYRAHLAADPELAARWHHAYAAYHAWFTTQQRS